MDLFLGLLFLGAVLTVRGQDPTSVCYPPVFQTTYFNTITEDKGMIYVDFAKQKFVEVSSVTNNRFIHDFATLKSYAISGQGNYTTCRIFNLHQSQVMYRCLPPYAKLVTDATGYFHYITANRMYVQTWDIESESDTVYRVSFSVVGGQPHWPIMAQEFGYHGTTNMYMYINPTNTIANQGVFNISADCVATLAKIAPIVG